MKIYLETFGCQMNRLDSELVAGLLRRASWSRPLALVVGFFDMMCFPLGTILGLYTFWVLLQDNAAAFFERGATATALDEVDVAPAEPQ